MVRTVVFVVIGFICAFALFVLFRNEDTQLPITHKVPKQTGFSSKLVLRAPYKSDAPSNSTSSTTSIDVTELEPKPTFLAASTQDAANTTITRTATTTTTPSCHTATFGTQCYKRVMWVMRYGVVQHPEWYP